jgi:dTDP-4-dehydrorhamnose reductase
MIGGSLKKGPIYDILNDQPLRLKKTSTIPVLHLEKICNTIKHLIISKKSNEVYNIASNNSISIADIASLMQKTPKYHHEAIHRELYIDNSKISKEIDMGSCEDSINLNCEN